jgi:hypothetical protein
MAPALVVTPGSDAPGHSSVLFSSLTDAFETSGDRPVVVFGDQRAFEDVWGLHNRVSGRAPIIVTEPVEPGVRAILDALFSSVTTRDELEFVVPLPELAEILESPDRRDLLIAVAKRPKQIDTPGLVLYRGDLSAILVPAEWFVARPIASPDLRNIAIVDSGQTLRLGDYEVATDAILYEWDPAFRQRLKSRGILRDPSFGGSVRRLRLQRGLRRSDFSGDHREGGCPD